MSNQIVITSGAKVRELNDVIIGTSGVLSSLAFNVANGVPKLDSNAKILVSQLPNSVMEYQGTWNAATNTPTLTNGGAFNQGDVYLCNVAGTTNFGAGPISFIVGDSAIYSGSIWQRSGGATGSVTSVGLSTDGNAITIGSSPITTSGTITANFNGTNLQYVNGAGNLTTFPTLISSIGLSMPSAFSVSNSPLTANGTIAVTGAGYPSQYIRGDGTLADFPTSGGGGSSVSYYLNGGTSQGTIGGVTYYEMSKTADTGTGVDFNKTGDGFIVAFLTDAGDPAQLNIPAGNWNYEIYASMSANGGTPEMYAELYKYDGTTFTLISTSSNEILYDGTNLNLYTFAMTVPSTTLTITDRLAIKLYATNSGGKITTVHTQDSHLCQVITTFSTGITALNGLTAQVQYFATGTSGTDFNISSATATHTFNIPDASASARGLITTGTQTIGGAKTYNNTAIFESSGGTGLKYGASISKGFTPFTFSNLAVSIYSDATTNNVIFRDNLSSAKLLFDNSTQTFTFPAASGTIALTSNLSSYVPYTGATTNVDLGNNYLISTNVVSTSMIITTGTNNVGGVKMANLTTITLGGSGGDNTRILPSSSERSIFFDQGYISGGSTFNKVFKFDLSSLTNATTRTYTLPDATGTLALTSNIPTVSGTTNYHAKFTGTNTIGNSLIWDNGTNVGIGNTNTSYTLDVSGTGRFTGALTGTSATFSSTITSQVNGSTFGTASATGRAIILQAGSSNQAILFKNAAGGDGTLYVTGTSTTLNYNFNTYSVGDAFVINNNGNIGIGTNNPFNKLTVNTGAANNLDIFDTGSSYGIGMQAVNGNNTAYKTWDFYATKFNFLNGNLFFFNYAAGTLSINSGNQVVSSSDKNLKTDDGEIINALDKVLKLTPRYFYWKDDSGIEDTSRQLGFYAQEVNEALGEEVANTPKKENDKWGIYDRGIIAMLTKAIQEQQIQIQNLQEQINILAK